MARTATQEISQMAVLFGLLSLIPSVSVASPSGCAHIKNDLDRLACYDKENGKTPETKIVPSESSAWIIRESKSELTDQKTVTITVDSDDPVTCRWNNNEKIRLVIRCMENKTVSYFATGCHMTSSDYNDYGEIMYRIDAEKAKTVNGDSSTDNRALGLWSGRESIPFIKSLIGRQKLTVRMTPYGENSFTATFNISGAEGAIAKVSSACGWK